MKLYVSRRCMKALSTALAASENPDIVNLLKRVHAIQRADLDYQNEKTGLRKSRVTYMQFIAIFEEIPMLLHDVGQLSPSLQHICYVTLARKAMTPTHVVLLRERLRRKGGSYRLLDVITRGDKAVSQGRRPLTPGATSEQ